MTNEFVMHTCTEIAGTVAMLLEEANKDKMKVWAIATELQPQLRLRVSVAISACVFIMISGAAIGGLRWNGTESAPVGIWHVVDRSPHRGDFVTFCPPNNAEFQEYHRRGYIGAGPCPGDIEKLLKPIAAVEGDLVAVTEDGVAVNGALIDETALLAADASGRPLAPFWTGGMVVEEGTVFVVSNHSRWSIDSRYFGPISVKSIEGVATPVMVGK